MSGNLGLLVSPGPDNEKTYAFNRGPAMPIDLINWKIEAQWLLTWYPRFQAANLKEVKMRGGAASHSTGDFGPGLGGGTRQVLLIGQGLSDDGEPLAPDGHGSSHVRASIDVGFAQERGQFFDIEVEVIIGRLHQTRYLRLLPDTRAPFMINVHASGEDPAIQGTAAVFQGVFVTGHPLLSDVLGPTVRK